MAGRARSGPRIWLPLLLLLAVALAGCTRDNGSGPGVDDNGSPGDEEPAPYLGILPGISSVPLNDTTAPGVIEGAVYAMKSGQLITDAVVVAQCVAVPGVPGNTTTVATDDGRFRIPPSFADGCLLIAYDVQHAAYRMAVPVEGPVAALGVLQQVRLGLVPGSP